ncbi:MAG: hypothetical protein ABIR11_06105 [Candidatus Limnocylindrales bacterium]
MQTAYRRRPAVPEDFHRAPKGVLLITRSRLFALLAALALVAAGCGGSAASTAPAAATDATTDATTDAPAESTAAGTPTATSGEDAATDGVGVVGCDRISDATIEAIAGAKVATAEQLYGTPDTAALGGCLWTTEVSDKLPVAGTVELQAQTNGQAALDELRQFQASVLTEETSLGVPASFGPADALFFVVDDQMYTLQVLAYGVDGHAAALTLAKALIAGG